MIRGRKPQPVALRVLRGNPGRRRLPRQDLKPEPGADCPDILSPIAKREWKRLAPELVRLGLLTKLDRAAFSAYCESVDDFYWAVVRLRRDGRVITAGNGTAIPHPAVQLKRQAMRTIREFSAEFGMTPSARTRVQEIPGFVRDPDEERYFGPR